MSNPLEEGQEVGGESIGSSLGPTWLVLKVLHTMLEARSKRGLTKLAQHVKFTRDKIIRELSAEAANRQDTPLIFWGVGCMVFCNITHKNRMGAVGRFLPLLVTPKVSRSGTCAHTCSSRGCMCLRHEIPHVTGR